MVCANVTFFAFDLAGCFFVTDDVFNVCLLNFGCFRGDASELDSVDILVLLLRVEYPLSLIRLFLVALEVKALFAGLFVRLLFAGSFDWRVCRPDVRVDPIFGETN